MTKNVPGVEWVIHGLGGMRWGGPTWGGVGVSHMGGVGWGWGQGRKGWDQSRWGGVGCVMQGWVAWVMVGSVLVGWDGVTLLRGDIVELPFGRHVAIQLFHLLIKLHKFMFEFIIYEYIND